ncbi:hypothetical protein LQM11_004532 [Vibrio parahaemolyticus]|uniref:hypothetical protein n=2 Tax=Vibrio parahaemolyticus TaxID=670 RepID=UPI000A3A5AA7|nr:hypothetical protein [Vibrio parahaemolyticus]HCZ9261832.1 hypothetical protein [Vibrio alginolyticus]EIO4563890.1 hypothetical protein [Vibrio parahaemolyticus]MDF4628090.1 hypothetical protein [Vibrio parahaemolyticus]OUJ38910.1 hypothetical protein BTZ05_23085 [Vibrio parahaemolyticus]HCG5228681.1 hypothetical protein [Vibrio parahaemolyticus]
MNDGFKTALTKVFEWCNSRPNYGVRTSDHSGRIAIKRLKKLSIELHNLLPDEYKDHFVPYFSKGKSSLPVILWVALCPKRRAVHNSMTIGFCFAKNGSGAVFGIMDSVSFSQKWLPTLERSPEKVESININATNYKYNNAFYNPMEVVSNEIDFDTIEERLLESCPILHEIIMARFQ